MSHFKERREKNCLNCNAEVHGKYCHVCGQENIEPKETAWHLITHFFNDITHFDGKFFSTLKLLIIRPGFLPKEYMIGRRNSYLNPVRMYIFTSAIFFLIFFSFFKIGGNDIGKLTINKRTVEEAAKMDSTAFANYTRSINRDDNKPDVPMTREEFAKYSDSATANAGIYFTNTRYRSKAQYDSVLASGKKDHNWIQRQLIYKQIEVNEKFKDNPRRIFSVFLETLIHTLPQMMFISLPLFALLLQMLYARRKQFYYVNHAIFTVHLYIFIFIVMLLLFGMAKLNSQLNWTFLKIVMFLLYTALFFYEYKALRNFYQQRRAKTIFKFLLLNLGFLIIVIILFTIFIFFSFFKI